MVVVYGHHHQQQQQGNTQIDKIFFGPFGRRKKIQIDACDQVCWLVLELQTRFHKLEIFISNLRFKYPSFN
jgi:hypothetical protein